MTSHQQISPAEWRALCDNDYDAKFNLTPIEHRNGTISAYLERNDDDLRLFAALDPYSNSSDVAALLVSVTLSLRAHSNNEPNQETTVAVSERLTNVLQGGCVILLMHDVPWGSLDPSKSATVSVSFKDAPFTWMGMSSLKPSQQKSDQVHTFSVDWRSLLDEVAASESIRIWENMLTQPTETWWLWFPPLEVTLPGDHGGHKFSLLKSSKKSESPPKISLIVAYLYASGDGAKSHVHVKAALHPLSPDENQPEFKVTGAEISLKSRDGGQLDESVKVNIFPRTYVSHRKRAQDYEEIVEFTIPKGLQDLDPSATPVVKLSLEKK